MQAIPAVDIFQGQVTRLTEGRYEQATTYALDLLACLQAYWQAGLNRVHLVDLDAARGQGHNRAQLSQILAHKQGQLHWGGGLRSVEAVLEASLAGVDYPVVGTAAIRDADFLPRLSKQLAPEKVIVSVDVRGNEVYVQGWTEQSGIQLEDALNRALSLGYSQFLCTDIAHDGKLQGPATALYARLCRQFPQAKFIASGGIRHLDDLEVLRQTGATAAVVGKALFEGHLSPAQLQQFNQKGA